MRDIERSLLLGALGWTETSNIEGSARWSQASEDMRSSLSYRVAQDAGSVSASVDLEGWDENFESVRRPLLLVEFKSNARGRMQLTLFLSQGAEQPLREESQPEALAVFARAKADFPGTPKLTLLGPFGSEPGVNPGVNL